MDTPYIKEDEQTKRKEEGILELSREPLLAGFKKADMQKFARELILIFDALGHIDRDYGEADNPDIEGDIKKFKVILKRFSEKYKNILAEFHSTDMECTIRLYIKENDLRRFAEVLKSIRGFQSFSPASDKIDAVFMMSDGKENLITFIPLAGRIKINYLKEDMFDPKSPEFRLCMYYALKEGVDTNIDIESLAGEFSFDLSTSGESQRQHDGHNTSYSNNMRSRF